MNKMFGRKKKSKKAQALAAHRCLYCGREVGPEDVAFCKIFTSGEPDTFKEAFLKRHFINPPDAAQRGRVWLPGEYEVTAYEGDSGLPLAARPKRQERQERWIDMQPVQPLHGDRGLSLSGDEEGPAISKHEWAVQEPVQWQDVILTNRICGHCHCSLPEGFGTDPVVRIGMLGGARCGKSTYIYKAADEMRHGFGGRLSLGEVALPAETKMQIDQLAEQNIGAAGIEKTVLEDRGMLIPGVFPAVMHILPNDDAYAPFFLVFQDIPGELMAQSHHRINDYPSLLGSDILFALVDVNQLTETERRICDDALEQANRSVLREYNISNYNDVYENVGKVKFRSLKGIVVVLTKTDLMPSEFMKNIPPSTGLKKSPAQWTQDHVGAVDESALKEIEAQARSVMQLMYAKKEGLMVGGEMPAGLLYEKTGFVPNIRKKLVKSKRDGIPFTYMAVSCRGENEGGRDALFRSNRVLDPVLRTISWLKLVPSQNKGPER